MHAVQTASALHVTNSFGEFQIIVFRDPQTGAEHVALTKGHVAGSAGILCRVASECITGMVLDAADCDCLSQLRFSLTLIDEMGSGVLILLRQEGRGHGLTTKIKALVNKNQGDNTFFAVERLGLPSDCRTYDIAAQILQALKVDSVRLITSNPDKVSNLSQLGIVITKVIPTPRFVTSRNERHLMAKVARGHRFSEDAPIA